MSASWLTELYHDTLVLFEATKFVVVSYGSHRKLIYLNKKSKRILQTKHSCISFLKGLKSDTANHLLNLVTLSLECSQNSILLLFTCLIFHPHWMVSSLRASSYRPQCQALYICTFYRVVAPYVLGKLNYMTPFICMRGRDQDRIVLMCSLSRLSKLSTAKTRYVSGSK